MPSVSVRWAKPEGDARILTLDAAKVTLWSSVASPPGSRIEGAVDGEPPAVLRVKIHSCRAQETGFLLEGRPIDLPKDVRERLIALLF